MPHYSRVYKVVIDVTPADHDREVTFWTAATGRPLVPMEQDPDYHHAALVGRDFVLLTQRLDEGASRVHLDIHTDDVDAEVARLEQLGARRVRKVRDWWIMEDPAGLPFCVLPDPPGRLTDANATRWD